MRDDLWLAITGLAEKQDGLVTTGQVMADVGRIGLERAVRAGLLRRVRRGVYVVRGAPRSGRTSVQAALSILGPDAVASHLSAAWLYGFLSDPPVPVDVTVPLGSHRAAHGVAVHRSDVPAHERAVVQGLAATSVARTIVDLAAVLPAGRVEKIVHEAVMRRLCRYEDVEAAVTRLRGRRGSARLQAMVGACLGDTPLEARWNRLIVGAGLPAPVRQHQVIVGGRVFVLDFAWPSAQVALETNGFDARRTRTGFDRDHDKVLALQSAGWTVYAVTGRTNPQAILPLIAQSIGANFIRG
jgi:very-short-patch-repair endonuclease